MALVQLSDAIVPEVFNNYMLNDTVEMADVFQSGLVRMDADMADKLSAGGRLFQTPVWNDLDNAAPAIGTDDPADVLTPQKVGSFKHQFARQLRTQAWSSADLVAELAGSDPMRRISSRVSPYWARYFDRLTMYTLNGVINDNVANDGSDSVHDITGAAGNVTLASGKVVPANTIHADAILEAKQTAGDKAESLKIIVMHSRLFTNLQLQNLIVYIPNARGEITIPTYLGYRVVVTDNVPAVDQGGGVFHYTTYLCGEGIVGFAEKPPANPIAVQREELQGNGMGIENLITRRQFAAHFYGYNFTDASVAGVFPTDAELELAANWDRAVPERKQVRFVAIVSAG